MRLAFAEGTIGAIGDVHHSMLVLLVAIYFRFYSSLHKVLMRRVDGVFERIQKSSLKGEISLSERSS